MTTPNPQKTTDRAVKESTGLLQLGYGYVDAADLHEAGDDTKHTIEVQPAGKNTTFPAQVAVTAAGDVNIPPADSGDDIPVLYTTRSGNIPVVINIVYGSQADVPEYEPGERRIGHSLTDANIYLDKDGQITVESDAGATVMLQDDGTVSINDGSEGAIYDVETTSSDGYLTSITLQRRDDILI